jgi:hypothetical protein
MKILFVARHFTYFRNFDSVVARLAARGHQVHLAADREEAIGGRELVERLAVEHPGVTIGLTPMQEPGRYTRVARALRLGLDYLRYCSPRYEAMPRLRQRAYERTPAFVLALARGPLRGPVQWILEQVERAVPRPAAVDDFLRQHRPDVLLITPLIELGSPQLDYVRAARALGIRSVLCVGSWDHLSSKALIRVPPDHLIVWNEVQRDEAARFHGISPDRVCVTGAQCFDRWFDRLPSRDRTTFCRSVGLPVDRPYLLYVCSALFRGSPPETGLVQRWVQAIRQSRDPLLREVGILVRPHPQRMDEWRHVRLDGAALLGGNPVDERSREDYFDSLYHSAAVVGLNTSALVEAAIVDRPVYTLLLPEFRENQEGTFHFQYLLTVGGGFLHTARTLEEHLDELAGALAGRPARSNHVFVERFVRPHGRRVEATAIFADTVERLAALPPPAPRPEPRWVWLLRPAVYALVAAARLPLLDRLYWNPRKLRQAAGA